MVKIKCKRINLEKCSYILLLVFVLYISIDPAGTILNLKEVFFVVLMFFAVVNSGMQRPISKDVLFIISYIIILSLYGFCVALIKGNLEDSDYAFAHIKSVFLIVLTFFLIGVKFEHILKVLYVNGLVLSTLTVLLFCVAQFNSDLFSIAYDTSLDLENIFISKRSYFGISLLGIYFKAAPLIFFSYVYSLYFLKKGILREISVTLSLFSLLVAGSRTPILIAILITIVYFFDRLRKHKLLQLSFISLFGTALLSLVIILASEKGEVSNAIKYGNISSYIEDISRGSNIFFGAGLGSVFYADGWGMEMSSSELTYFDIIRIYGLPLSIVYIFLLIYPAIVFYNNEYYSKDIRYKRFVLAYLMYMLIAGTNPLLISSTGMLVWSIGLCFINNLRSNKL